MMSRTVRLTHSKICRVVRVSNGCAREYRACRRMASRSPDAAGPWSDGTTSMGSSSLRAEQPDAPRRPPEADRVERTSEFGRRRRGLYARISAPTTLKRRGTQTPPAFGGCSNHPLGPALWRTLVDPTLHGDVEFLLRLGCITRPLQAGPKGVRGSARCRWRWRTPAAHSTMCRPGTLPLAA